MSNHYDENNFWAKVTRWGRRAGRGMMLEVLAMWHAMQDPNTPTWARAVIAGALGYFILPLDALPDPIFIDDAAVVAQALCIVRLYVHDAHFAAARVRVDRLFGSA